MNVAAATLRSELPVFVLTGPTGVGKSDWAIRLANEAAVEIVSVDSALVYRGLDIGSAKPARELRQRIPHHLVDICRESRIHDTDAGLIQEASGPCQKIGINPSPQLFGFLSCEDCGALDGHAACQQDQITDGDARLPHKSIQCDLAEHLTNQNRAVEALRDFRVPAAEREPQFVARGPHIGQDRLGQFSRRAALRKEHDDEEPQRACAQDRNIVRVDVNCVAPDVISGKGDGICGDDEIAIACVDDGRILSNLRSNK